MLDVENGAGGREVERAAGERNERTAGRAARAAVPDRASRPPMAIIGLSDTHRFGEAAGTPSPKTPFRRSN
jgi:hypothetical protein